MADKQHPRTLQVGAPHGASALDVQMAVLDLLRQFFLGGPSEQVLEFVGSLDATELPGDDLAGIRQTVNAVAEGLNGTAGYAEQLRAEFTRLFEGPGVMPVVPFASYHLSRSKVLMTGETLAVRSRYLEAGVAVEALNRMPDDYLGVELEFLYYLTREALAARETGNDATAELRLAQRSRFIADHFRPWVPKLADALEGATDEVALQGLAQVLRNLERVLV